MNLPDFFETTLDTSLDGIILTDHNFKIIHVNKLSTYILGYNTSELFGQNLSTILGTPAIDTLKNLLKHESFDVVHNPQEILQKNILTVKNKKNNELDILFNISKTTFNSDEIYILSFEDITKEHRYKYCLEKLNEISSETEATLYEKIEQILNIGLKYYDMEIAIISNIDTINNTYKIEYVAPILDSPAVGDTFEFQETYCHFTFNANGPLGFYHAKNEEVTHHPCYEKFRLESYIGTPIFVEGVRHGTVNFSSKEPRSKPFDQEDHNFINLIAKWISYELTTFNYINRIKNISNELDISNKKLQFLANYDKLTELANRTLLFESLHYAQENAIRYERSFAIFFIDLDNFKEINDSLGHDAGDMYLASFSKKLRHIFRSGDMVSRYGGDEFVVILENITSKEECMPSCNKILETTKNPISINGKEFNIQCSIGIALFPQDAQNTNLLLQKADHAMYEAKKEDGSSYYFTS